MILDLTMPVMDGLEAFERLISLKPDARIIVSSGFAHGSIMEKFKGKPLAGILHKPYSLHEITLAVGQAIKRPPGVPDGRGIPAEAREPLPWICRLSPLPSPPLRR